MKPYLYYTIVPILFFTMSLEAQNRRSKQAQEFLEEETRSVQYDDDFQPVPVKISKTLDGRAIIRYRNTFQPQPGDVYVLTRREDYEAQRDRVGGFGEESRSRLLGIKFDVSLLTDKASGASEGTQRQSFTTEFKYGWNSGSVEYGPLVDYSFGTQGKVDTKSLLLGGFFDFNFSPNTVDASSLFAFRLTGSLGQDDNSAQTKAASVTKFSASLVYKWFGLSTNFAFDVDIGYLMRESSLDSAKTTTSGLMARLGLQTYF